MPTEKEHENAYNNGVEAAKSMLASSSAPLFIKDEYSFNDLANSEAMGWNSVWASEENNRRWQDYREQQNQSPAQIFDSHNAMTHMPTRLITGGNDSVMLVDVGTNTADAARQTDGSWNVYGRGSNDLIAYFALSAERKARKVGFLPQQVARKVARSARLAFLTADQITLRDGTVIRRTNG